MRQVEQVARMENLPRGKSSGYFIGHQHFEPFESYSLARAATAIGQETAADPLELESWIVDRLIVIVVVKISKHTLKASFADRGRGWE